MKFRNFILIACGSYVVLTTILIIAAYKSTTIDEFAKLATVGVAILTGLLSISVSTFTEYRNYKTEKEKGQLSVTLSEMSRDFSQQLALLNSKLAGELEFQKGKMNWKRKAYDELSNAVSVLFYSLAEAEKGQFDKTSVGNGNNLAITSSRYLGACTKHDQEIWNDFRQRA
jgi:hypothetical protein